MTDVIVIDRLTKSFKGKTVLEDINMRLQEGGIYGIVGDNGSGKTVLLKLICGFMKPDSGTVTVNGKTATVNGVKCKTYKITFEGSDDVLLAYDEQNEVRYEYDSETKDWIEL